MIRVFFFTLSLSFLTVPTFAVDRQSSTRSVPQSTNGRFQMFQGRVYPDFDVLLLIDSETGRTWRYSAEPKTGWFEQPWYEIDTKKPAPRERNEKDGKQ